MIVALGFPSIPPEVYLNISRVADGAIQGTGVAYLRGRCRELLELHEGRRKTELFAPDWHYLAYFYYAQNSDPGWEKLRAFVDSPEQDRLTRSETEFLSDLSIYCHGVGMAQRRDAMGKTGWGFAA